MIEWDINPAILFECLMTGGAREGECVIGWGRLAIFWLQNKVRLVTLEGRVIYSNCD